MQKGRAPLVPSAGTEPAGQAQAELIADESGSRAAVAMCPKLCGGQPYSISQLAKNSRLTRQAITKHLRVLESVGIVHSVQAGRESRFEFNPAPIAPNGTLAGNATITVTLTPQGGTAAYLSFSGPGTACVGASCLTSGSPPTRLYQKY